MMTVVLCVGGEACTSAQLPPFCLLCVAPCPCLLSKHLPSKMAEKELITNPWLSDSQQDTQSESPPTISHQQRSCLPSAPLKPPPLV